MRSFISFIVLVAWMGQSLAQTITIQNDVNARSSMDFRSRSNILSVIPQGTEGKVLERHKLPSGNYAIKMKVSKLGGDPVGNVGVGDEVWVYYHRDASRRFVELYRDDQGKKVVTDNVEAAEQTEALKTFKMVNSAEKGQTVSKQMCATSDAVDSKNAKMVSSQVDCLKKFAMSNIPELDPTTEEIITYIRASTRDDGRSDNDNPAVHREIALNVKKYCKLYGVSIPLVLAIMRKESEFVPTAGSGAGAKGLMQLMPNTARSLADGKSVDRTHVETNIKLAVKLLKELSTKYSGNLVEILIAYNGSPKRVQDYIRKGVKGITRETRNYIKVVPSYLAAYQSVIKNTGLVFD